MSEHRRPGWIMSRNARRAVPEVSHCPHWDCRCNQRLLFYQDKFAGGEDEDWTLAELATVETLIFMDLSCMEARSPEPEMRRWATVQLMNPWWNRQRRGEEITEEFIRDG